MENERIFRRKRRDPCSDFWHTLRIGLPVSLFLFFVLPHFLR